jgi:hypothetical protein
MSEAAMTIAGELRKLLEKAHDGPWYVRDFRAAEMRRLGWTGPAIDRILITNKTGAEIEASSGADSVIARIQFDNRPDELGDINIADAELIAAAKNHLPALLDALDAAPERERKMREALKVFAGPPETGEHESAVPNDSPITIRCQLGDVRRARAVLREPNASS